MNTRTQMTETANVYYGVTLLAKDDIKKDQDGIGRDLAKMDKRIHANAVQCLIHASIHGDTTLLQRLILEKLTGKNGYNTAGLIQWVRQHSPIEFKAKTLNLSGIIEDENQRATLLKKFPEADKDLFVVGQRRPFMIEEANASPFYTDSANAARVVRPLFQQTITGVFQSRIAEFRKAAENTVNGKPVDASKPYYDGKDVDKVAEIFDRIDAELKLLPKDMTREIRKAQEDLKRLTELEALPESEAEAEVGIQPEKAA